MKINKTYIIIALLAVVAMNIASAYYGAKLAQTEAFWNGFTTGQKWDLYHVKVQPKGEIYRANETIRYDSYVSHP